MFLTNRPRNKQGIPDSSERALHTRNPTDWIDDNHDNDKRQPRVIALGVAVDCKVCNQSVSEQQRVGVTLTSEQEALSIDIFAH